MMANMICAKMTRVDGSVIKSKTFTIPSKTGSLWSVNREEALQQALARTAMGRKAAGAVGSYQTEAADASQEGGE